MKASFYNARVLKTDIRQLDSISLTVVRERVHETKKRNFLSLSDNKEQIGKVMFNKELQVEEM
jgi:hypothetical protein